MKILLTGANGQLGRCIQDRLPASWVIMAASSADLDICDENKVFSLVSSFQPDFIVNAAAYTAVDKAEQEPEVATLVNATGPNNLASAAKEQGSRLIHISTDYVFDGCSATPYRESDQTNPLGIYGKSKLEGERAVSETLPGTIIIRTAWVFSEYGNNFLKTMLRLGAERDTLGVVADQHGCPTYAGDVASAIFDLIKSNANGGIYHFCGDHSVTWHQFADEIFRQAVSLKKLPKSPSLKGISTAEYPTPAVRPAFSSLNTMKIQSLGINASDWKVALGLVINKI